MSVEKNVMADDGGNGDGDTGGVRDPSEWYREIKGGIRDSSEDLDSISSLPDEILQQILSSIQTEEAIRTSVLSRRWRHVWSNTPSLSFDWHRNRILDADSIDKTLARYTARKMMSFHIDIDMMSNLTHIDSWIELVMSRNVENLSLELGSHPSRVNYTIPDFFYTNSSLKQLTLRLGYSHLIPSCHVSWTSLKKLSLFCCNLSAESIAKILSGCPILESLTFKCCDQPMLLDLSNSPRLRVLEITSHTGLEQIVAPHIHCLRLRNSSQNECTLVDVSSLTKAELDICFHPLNQLLKAYFLQLIALEQLDKLQNVNNLTLGENFLKILSLAELRGVLFPLFKAQVLTLEITFSSYVIPGIVRVLQNSPELKKLTLIHKRHCRSFIPEEDLDKYLGSRGLIMPQRWVFETYYPDQRWVFGTYYEYHDVDSTQGKLSVNILIGSFVLERKKKGKAEVIKTGPKTTLKACIIRDVQNTGCAKHGFCTTHKMHKSVNQEKHYVQSL